MAHTSQRFTNGEARQLVDAEIGRLYRQWGAAGAEAGVEREDLVQIGLLSLIQAGTSEEALGRIAIRHDFSDLLRSSSGIRRKHKSLQMGLQPVLQAGHGYAPLEPIRGYGSLTEVEEAAHCERELLALSRKRPKAMECILGLASGEDTAQIAQRLSVLRGTVHAHCCYFRQALAT